MAKKSKPAAAAVKKVIRRYVSPNRVEEREGQGWKRVQGGKDSVLRNGSILIRRELLMDSYPRINLTA